MPPDLRYPAGLINGAGPGGITEAGRRRQETEHEGGVGRSKNAVCAQVEA